MGAVVQAVHVVFQAENALVIEPDTFKNAVRFSLGGDAQDMTNWLAIQSASPRFWAFGEGLLFCDFFSIRTFFSADREF